MVCVRSLRISTLIAGGMAAPQPRQLRLDAVDSLYDVGARLLEHDEEHAPLAGRPCGLLGILRPGDGPPDVAHAQRRAVAVGDDDVVPWLGNGQLIVGIDGVASHLAVDAALGRIDGRDRQLGAHVLERDVLGHQLGRIELDADGGLLLASDGHLANAGDLADLLGQHGIGVVVHLDQRQGVGGHRQEQDRRVGRVDLAIGRR